MKIFLVRHGESEANEKGIHQGQRIDTGLSKRGKEQAKLIAERLKDEKIEAIYSSDLKRAKETAEEIAKFHKKKIILDKRLREFDLGDFTELENRWELMQEHKKKESERLGIKRWEVSPPGGESEWAHILRVKSFLKDIEQHEGNIIVVAHGGTNRIFFGVTGHTSMEKMYEHKQENTCLNIIEKNEGDYKVHLINCTRHLEDKERLKLPFRKNCEGYLVLGDSVIARNTEYGYIDFPGGGVEEKEDIKEALKRESFEEAGVILEGELKEAGVIRTIWPADWAKNEKQKKRFEKYKGDEMHFFIGKVKDLVEPKGDSEEKGWDVNERLMKISDAIKTIGGYRHFPKELEEYYEFKLKVLGKLINAGEEK